MSLWGSKGFVAPFAPESSHRNGCSSVLADGLWVDGEALCKKKPLTSSHPPRKGTLLVDFGPDNSLNLKTFWW